MSVPTITIQGRLGTDPAQGATKTGATYARLFIISSTRRLNQQTNQWEDGDRFAINATVFDDPEHHHMFASNILASLHKGDAVIAVGRLRQESRPDAPQGTPPYLSMRLDDIAPSLRYATARVVRNQHAQQPQQPQQQPQQSYGSAEQAWGGSTDFGAYGDGTDAF